MINRQAVTVRILALTILFLTSVSALSAQTYSECVNSNPDGVETTLIANAFIFDSPTEDAQALGRFEKGKAVFAYGLKDGFYAVASQERGFVGYILMTKLDVEQDSSIEIVSPIAKANYKDPNRARNLSTALPGGGQFYVGNQRRGTIVLLGAVASFVGGYGVSLNSTERICQNEEFQTECANETDRTGLVAGSALAAGFWIWGILKAKGDANAANAAYQQNATILRPMIQEGGIDYGLSLSISF